jgi:hypothetical protein
VYVKAFGGDTHVYAALGLLTDCATLEKEFAQHEEESQRQEYDSPRKKALVGYMVAISDRMIALRCSNDL